MAYRLDEIDKRILYYLAKDARNTTAPQVAEEMDVSPGTIRNRIEKLEDNGVITGYHAEIDYERAENLLTALFVCNAPVLDRDGLAAELLTIPGVVNVRATMTGRENLHVKAVGEDTDDVARIGRAIADRGVEIENEGLIQEEHVHPYQPYGPEDGSGIHPAAEFLSLTGDAEVAEVRLTEGAPAADRTIGEVDSSDLLPEAVLVVAIEREGEIITPKGDTTLRAGDLVNLLFRDGVSETVLREFGGELVRR